ncbi:MAG: TIGR03617 family F420-dependent LLM class oxidoreductase [Pseudomonadota bacterium]
MYIDGPFYAGLGDAAAEAERLARIGYDGVYTLEGPSDPFLPLAIASEHAPGLTIGTAVAVAFPRNPSHIAYQAWDLQRFSGGKFRLGIGSQIRAHIEKRFGVAFDKPASRMADYISAVKAFFRCWQDNEPLDHRGEFFQHTLMTPMFNPGPLEQGPPPILLGGVGPRMTEVAGEFGDGLIVHPFHCLPFLQEQQLPALERGIERSGRSRAEVDLQVSAMVVTGETEEAYQAAESSIRSLLAFYASTPAYLPPLEAAGYAELQPELNRLSKAGEWDVMAERIDDGMLQAFAVCGEPHTIGPELKRRYGDFVQRLGIYAPYAQDEASWTGILEDLKAGRSDDG